MIYISSTSVYSKWLYSHPFFVSEKEVPLLLPGISLFFTLPPAQGIGYTSIPPHPTPWFCMFNYVANIFILLRLSFTKQKCLILMKSSLSIIFFQKICLWFVPKKLSSDPRSSRHSGECYFLIVCSFSFRSVFH